MATALWATKATGLSTSVTTSVPDAVATPAVAFATPPFSVTEPVEVPVMAEASLLPLIVTSICCVCPSAVATVTSSCSEPPSLRPCTVALLSSSV